MSAESKTGLIIPPSPFLADERVFPFLGILKVASAMREKGHKVDVLDLSGYGNYEQIVETYLKREKPDRIGLTATTPQLPQAVKITEVARRVSPDTRVIFGGAHATMVGSANELDAKRKVEHRGTMAFRQMTDIFDVVVVGDGEEAVFEAIKDNAPKVIDAGPRDSAFFLKRGTLEKYPFPARELIDLDSYHYQIDGKDAQSMIAQLGCPFDCGFCGGRNTPAFRIARNRSTESILEEVDILAGKYGKRGVMFYDDELNISNESLMPLMEGLIKYQEKHDIELRLRGFVKAELFTAEQARAMYRAGFRIMLSGVESGDDRILDTMHKHTTREINSRWVRLCHEAGLKAKALMSMGHPGETEQSIRNSLEWVLSNKPDDVDWTIITEYPGSPYFDFSTPHPTEAGTWVFEHPKNRTTLFSKDVNFAEKAEYYKGVPGDYTSYVWTEQLSPEKLVELREEVEATSRRALNLPEIQTVAAQQFEHSMGQKLPRKVLRSSDTV